MRSLASSPRLSRSQKGGALLVMLVILVIGITTAFVNSLSQTAITNKRNQATADALARAKEALIGYALSYGDTHPDKTHGYLPCPDKGTLTEGTAPSECAGVNELGRLPWRTLGVSPLSDGAGECLWYAVSGNYGNKSLSLTMNWDTPVSLKLHDSNGNEIAQDEVVALVIAPGAPVSGNSDRSGSVAPICGGNHTPAAYLDNDTTHSFNNADGVTGEFILPHEHRDANGNITLTVNDQFAVITRQDIWYAVENRIAREVRQCLDDYANTSGGKYPWPAPVLTGAYSGVFDTFFGRVADIPNTYTYALSDPLEINMLNLLGDLQVALNAYAANNTWDTRNTLDNTGDDLKDVSFNIINATSPPYPPDVVAVATPARWAGIFAENLVDGDYRWNGSSWVLYTVSDVQNRIDAANTALSALSDPGMQKIWPAGCFDAATKPYWMHWKELVFYQIADGYKPGSAGDCVVSSTNTCLSLQSSSQAVNGSGTHHSVLIVAGRKLTANRVTTTVDDYLEPDNVTATGAPTVSPFKTYRISDTEYQNINDRVLCVDGKVNCQ